MDTMADIVGLNSAMQTSQSPTATWAAATTTSETSPTQSSPSTTLFNSNPTSQMLTITLETLSKRSGFIFPITGQFLTSSLCQVSRLDEAINAFRSALHLKADHPHAYNNLGNAMIEKGYIKEAIHCYVTAIRLMPKFSAAHCNLGSVFKEQGHSLHNHTYIHTSYQFSGIVK